MMLVLDDHLRRSEILEWAKHFGDVSIACRLVGVITFIDARNSLRGGQGLFKKFQDRDCSQRTESRQT